MAALTDIETKPGTFTITDPNWPTYTPVAVNPTIASDSFSSGSGELNGRSTDNAYGGTTKQWTVETGQFTVTSGRVNRTGSGNGFAYIAGPADCYVTAQIAALPTSGYLWLDARRSGTTSYRIQVGSSGAAILQKRVSGTTTALASDIPVAAGDTLELRVVGTTIAIVKNGIVAATVTDTSVVAAGNCGVAVSSTSAGGAFDAFVLREINNP